MLGRLTIVCHQKGNVDRTARKYLIQLRQDKHKQFTCGADVPQREGGVPAAVKVQDDTACPWLGYIRLRSLSGLESNVLKSVVLKVLGLDAMLPTGEGPQDRAHDFSLEPKEPRFPWADRMMRVDARNVSRDYTHDLKRQRLFFKQRLATTCDVLRDGGCRHIRQAKRNAWELPRIVAHWGEARAYSATQLSTPHAWTHWISDTSSIAAVDKRVMVS
jgi:hypothetical protein